MPIDHRHALQTSAVVLLGPVVLAVPVAAHAGSFRAVSEVDPVPVWLVLLTGGGVIAVSFLLASLVTDRTDIIAFHAIRTRLFHPTPVLQWIPRILGVILLLAVIWSGLFGPEEPTMNLAMLIVWVGWWAGYPMTVYLLGNSWPALNPWRTLAAILPSRHRDYPQYLAGWPAVAGLLALVWLEVITPVAEIPWLLTVTVLAYSAVTIAGAIQYGPDTWFETADPIARVFDAYGQIAPIQRTPDGLEVRLPGAILQDASARGYDEIAFIIALLWVTTYDGLIATPRWAALIRPLVTMGLPPIAVYLATIVLGFGAFLGIYRLAAILARRSAGSYVSRREIEARFAPSLLPIAAGYHFAHFIGYFLSLLPALLTALGGPLITPQMVPVVSLPVWFGVVGLIAVLVGHALAIWVAHATSFDLFTGRLQPLRSQYPFIVIMIFYTMTSMWIVTQPYAAPPFV